MLSKGLLNIFAAVCLHNLFLKYKKKKYFFQESKWTSKANDITQTVRRYYSNALTDTEKQNT